MDVAHCQNDLRGGAFLGGCGCGHRDRPGSTYATAMVPPSVTVRTSMTYPPSVRSHLPLRGCTPAPWRPWTPAGGSRWRRVRCQRACVRVLGAPPPHAQGHQDCHGHQDDGCDRSPPSPRRGRGRVATPCVCRGCAWATTSVACATWMHGTPAVQTRCLDSGTTDSPPCLGFLAWCLRAIQGRLRHGGRAHHPQGTPVASAARPLVPWAARSSGACGPPGLRRWSCTTQYDALPAFPHHACHDVALSLRRRMLTGPRTPVCAERLQPSHTPRDAVRRTAPVGSWRLRLVLHVGQQLDHEGQ